MNIILKHYLKNLHKNGNENAGVLSKVFISILYQSVYPQPNPYWTFRPSYTHFAICHKRKDGPGRTENKLRVRWILSPIQTTVTSPAANDGDIEELRGGGFVELVFK